MIPDDAPNRVVVAKLRALLVEGARACMTAAELEKTKAWRQDLWTLAQEIEERMDPVGARTRRELKAKSHDQKAKAVQP